MTTPPPLVYLTGASSGIGQALARHYFRAGWRVALVARRPESLAAWARDEGWGDARDGRYRIYVADVADTAAMATAGRDCIAQMGLPDVVIACAGISIGVDLADAADLPVLQRILDTNVVGLAATLQPFIQPMQQARRGTLVGIASVTGVRGLPGHAAYCASKSAAIGLCESLRGECRPYGVRVVTLLPGYIDTPMTAHDTYRRPFLMQPDDFARAAARAIARGDAYRVIPWQMAWIARVLRVLPCAVLDRLLAGRPRKPRQDQRPLT